MSTTDVFPSKVHWFAKRLEEDIRTRSFRVGEPYLTTTQVGRQLGISKAMAHRTMKLLSDRQILTSHVGRGTFIGPEAGSLSSTQVKCIHILLTHDYFQSLEQITHGWLAGLSETLVGCSVQFNFIPKYNAEAQVSCLLEQGKATGTLSAVILVGCSQAVQERVSSYGVPTLVFGTDYSSTRQLPSVDADQYEIGRLATRYLVERGHRRIALVMRELWLPGDRRMLEGVGCALDEAHLGHKTLKLRNMSVDPAVLDADLRRLLTTEDRPTGCVCRTPFFAKAVLQAAKSAGLVVPADLDVVTDSSYQEIAASLPLASVCLKISVQEQMKHAGRMLLQLLNGQQPDPCHVIQPVELFEPNEGGDQTPKSGNASAVVAGESQ